jgi:hypothetical protein
VSEEEIRTAIGEMIEMAEANQLGADLAILCHPTYEKVASEVAEQHYGVRVYANARAPREYILVGEHEDVRSMSEDLSFAVEALEVKPE